MVRDRGGVFLVSVVAAAFGLIFGGRSSQCVYYFERHDCYSPRLNVAGSKNWHQVDLVEKKIVFLLEFKQVVKNGTLCLNIAFK